MLRRYVCFHVVVTDGHMPLILCILWKVSRSALVVLLAIGLMLLVFNSVYWFSRWSVICCFCCDGVVPCCVAENDGYNILRGISDTNNRWLNMKMKKKIFQIVENKCIYGLAIVHVHKSTAIFQEEARQTHS
jgi:hypothetical protein